MSTPAPAPDSSSSSSSPAAAADPIPSSIFLSTFIPVLIVAAYTLFAIYKLYTTLSHCQGRLGTQRLLRAWRACTGREREGGYVGVAHTDAVDDEEEVGDVVPLTRIPRTSIDNEHEADQQLQQENTHNNNNGTPPPPPTITLINSSPVLEPSASRPRRKPKPPPLSLQTWPRTRAEAEEATSAALDIARFFDGGTGQLRDDIILRPSTGLDALCVHVPEPERRGRGSFGTDYVVEWINWVVDRGVPRALTWLEVKGVGDREYQRIPEDDDSP